MKLSFITPDYLYDYFENELRKELNSSDIHKVYALATKILRNFNPNSLSAKIIKCIAVIHFVQQFERLAPVTDTICNIYCMEYDSKEVIECIKNLINEQYILYRKLSNNFLCLKETSGIDINEENRTKERVFRLNFPKKYIFLIIYIVFQSNKTNLKISCNTLIVIVCSWI